MALTARSFHDVVNLDSSWDTRYPNGDKAQIQPATLGINLAAFTAANFNLNSQAGGAPLSFNYRQFLTGTSASTATLSVNATAGILGNWVIDATGNNLANPNTVAGSGSLQVLGQDTSGNSVGFPIQPWNLSAQVTQGVTKFRPGHGVWFYNTYWDGNEGPAFLATIDAIGNDPLGPSHIVVYGHWSIMEGAQGDYSAGKAIVRSILARFKTYPRPLYLTWRCITRSFDGSLAGASSWWPAYVRANSPSGNDNSIQGGNGWIVNCAPGHFPPVATCSQLNLGNAACMAAWTTMWKSYLAEFDPDPNMENWCPFDESIQINGPGSVNEVTPDLYYAVFKKFFMDIKPSAPTTQVQIALNFFNDFNDGSMTGAQQISDILTSFTTAFPGGVSVGGPDPSPVSTTAHNVLNGTTGGKDWRGQVIVHDMVQGIPLLTGSSPAKVAAACIGPAYTGSPVVAANDHAYYMIWNREATSWPAGNNWTDQQAIIHAMSNKTNTDIPTIGTFNTVPGIHA